MPIISSHQIHKEDGITLVEIVVVTGISLLLFSALISLVTITLKNSTFARKQAQATKLAREGMELVRAFRDRNGYDQLAAKVTDCSTSKCDISLAMDGTISIQNTASANGSPTSISSLNRAFTLSSTNPQCTGIMVTMQILDLSENSGQNKRIITNLDSCFTKWR